MVQAAVRPAFRASTRNISGPRRRGEIAQQREYRLALGNNFLNRFAHQRMVNGDHRQRINPRADVADLCGDEGGNEFIHEFDDGLAANGRGCLGGIQKFIGKRLVEIIAALLQQEAHGAGPDFGHALLEQAGGVIADGFGGGHNAQGRILAHRQAPVQDPVHGGNAHPRLARQIGNGCPLAHSRFLQK